MRHLFFEPGSSPELPPARLTDTPLHRAHTNLITISVVGMLPFTPFKEMVMGAENKRWVLKSVQLVFLFFTPIQIKIYNFHHHLVHTHLCVLNIECNSIYSVLNAVDSNISSSVALY